MSAMGLNPGHPVEWQDSAPGARNRKSISAENGAHSNIGSKHKLFLGKKNRYYFPPYSTANTSFSKNWDSAPAPKEMSCIDFMT